MPADDDNAVEYGLVRDVRIPVAVFRNILLLQLKLAELHRHSPEHASDIIAAKAGAVVSRKAEILVQVILVDMLAVVKCIQPIHQPVKDNPGIVVRNLLLRRAGLLLERKSSKEQYKAS